MKRFRIPASWPALRLAICLAAAVAVTAPASASVWNLDVDSAEDARDADLNDGRCIATNGRCTLRAAVEQANYLSTSANLFTIHLRDTLYRLSSPLAFKATITIYGRSDQATVIDCQNVTRTLANLEALQLHGLKLWQCPGTDNRGRLELHGVRVENGSGASAILNQGIFLALSSTFTGNFAGWKTPGGAALYNAASGHATLLSSHFEGNLAGQSGGVVHNLGTVVMSVCRFFQNAANGRGGAVYNQGQLHAELTTFDENEGSDGGAIYNTGQAEVVKSGFVRNSVEGSGGAIWSSAPLQLVNSTVSGNAATLGGGLYGSGEANSLYLANSTITQNVVSSSESPASARGGGLHGVAILRNTILASNKSYGGSGQDCYTGRSFVYPLSQGYNIIGIMDGCGLSLTRGDSAGSASRPLNPGLLPLDETTWYPPFHPLDASSPAVDRGNPRGCRMPLTEALLSSDQIEWTRHHGAACDAGAIELYY